MPVSTPHYLPFSHNHIPFIFPFSFFIIFYFPVLSFLLPILFYPSRLFFPSVNLQCTFSLLSHRFFYRLSSCSSFSSPITRHQLASSLDLNFFLYPIIMCPFPVSFLSISSKSFCPINFLSLLITLFSFLVSSPYLFADPLFYFLPSIFLYQLSRSFSLPSTIFLHSSPSLPHHHHLIISILITVIPR